MIACADHHAFALMQLLDEADSADAFVGTIILGKLGECSFELFAFLTSRCLSQCNLKLSIPNIFAPGSDCDLA